MQNDLKMCYLSEHAFSYLIILFETALKVVRPTEKSPTLNPTSGETPIKSTKTCFPSTYCILEHPKSISLFMDDVLEIVKKYQLCSNQINPIN
jgi:hypothetical protein